MRSRFFGSLSAAIHSLHIHHQQSGHHLQDGSCGHASGLESRLDSGAIRFEHSPRNQLRLSFICFLVWIWSNIPSPISNIQYPVTRISVPFPNLTCSWSTMLSPWSPWLQLRLWILLLQPVFANLWCIMSTWSNCWTPDSGLRILASNALPCWRLWQPGWVIEAKIVKLNSCPQVKLPRQTSLKTILIMLRLYRLYKWRREC